MTYLSRILCLVFAAASLTAGAPAFAQSNVGVSTEAIVNGRPVEVNEMHGTVEIVSSPRHRGFCSGTLIAPRLVMTAGHCVVSLDRDGEPIVAEPDEVAVGAGHLSRGDRINGEIVPVAEVIVHQGFDISFSSARGETGLGKPHDIALLVLDVPVTMVTPVAIPSARHDELAEDAPALVSGYGTTEGLSAGDLRITETWIDQVTKKEVLTSAPSAEYGDSCFGDSGGPLYLDGPNGLFLVGVVSRARADAATDCGDGGIYTRASSYRKWVESVLKDMGDPEQVDPGYKLVGLPYEAGTAAGCSVSLASQPGGAGTSIAFVIALCVSVVRRSRR